MGNRKPLILKPRDLPKIASIHVWPRNSCGVVTVSIGLEDDTRIGIAKWAEHLGAAITEHAPEELIPGRWRQQVEAVHEADGVVTSIWTFLLVERSAAAPAETETAPPAGAETAG
jgi:hypothetical protein